LPKQYRGMAGDVRALTAYVKLLRAGEGVLGESSRLLALYDLTPNQFGVLESLYESGPQPLAALAQGILKTSGSLATVVRSLRKRGLVRPNAAGRDRRLRTVTLTPKGRNLLRSVLPGHGAVIVSVMARLSPSEQETLGKLCRKLSQPSPAPGAKPAGATLPNNPRRRARPRR